MSIGQLKQSALLSPDVQGVAIKPRKKVEGKAQTFAKHDDPEDRVVYLDGDVSTLEYYVCDFDINGFGKQVYNASTKSANSIGRFGIGAVAAAMSVLSRDAIIKLIGQARGRKLLEYGAASRKRIRGQALRMKKAPTWFQRASAKARALCGAAGRLAGRSPHALLRIAGAGTTAFTYLIVAKDLAQWLADATQDFANKYTYSWSPTFDREHFARLSAILRAGTEAKMGKRQGGVIAISGTDIKLMAILCSTPVVGTPVDIATASTLAQTLADLAERVGTDKSLPNGGSIDDLLQKTKIRLYIGDPADESANEERLRELEIEVKQLLLRFRRSIEDIGEWDAEDILVPLIAIAERYVRIPGMIARFAGIIAGGSEAAFFNSFDDETVRMVDALDRSVVNDDEGVLGSVKSFLLDALSTLGVIEPAAEQPESTSNNTVPGGI